MHDVLFGQFWQWCMTEDRLVKYYMQDIAIHDIVIFGFSTVSLEV